MIPKSVQQYNLKVRKDLLNQLPYIFDESLVNKSIEELLKKYYIFHHYGISLDKKGQPIEKPVRYLTHQQIDIINLKPDKKKIAKKMYELEYDQTKYFLTQISKLTGLKNKKVLDIGSGSGGMSYYLAEKYHSYVTALNYSQNQNELVNSVSFLKKLDKRVKTVIYDMNKLDLFADKQKHKFDLCIQNETDMYVNNLGSFFNNIKVLLRKNGIYSTIGWYKTSESKNVKEIDKYYFTSMKDFFQIKEAIVNSGFIVIKEVDLTEAVKPYWYLRNTFELTKGIVEAEFIGGMENGSIKYKMLIAAKS